MAGGRVSLGNPLPFALGAVREGLSARASLTVVRESGWAISNDRWLSAMRTAQQITGLRPGLDQYALNSPLPPEAHVPWAAGTPGTYLYNVTIHAYDPGTGLISPIAQSIKSDIPLTPGEAAQITYDEWADPENVNIYDLVPTGATLDGAYYMTGPDAP